MRPVPAPDTLSRKCAGHPQRRMSSVERAHRTPRRVADPQKTAPPAAPDGQRPPQPALLVEGGSIRGGVAEVASGWSRRSPTGPLTNAPPNLPSVRQRARPGADNRRNGKVEHVMSTSATLCITQKGIEGE